MHDFVSFNSQIIPAKDSFLSTITPAVFYGKSVFTTIAVYNSKPFLWSKHWRRLTANAGKLIIGLSEFSEHSVKYSLNEIIAKNEIINGRARLTFLDVSASKIWQNERQDQTYLSINTADFRNIPGHFRLSISPDKINSTSLLTNIKSGNYLENILALEKSQTDGFDEAVRLNERNEVVSACMANIFWQKDSKLFTPDLTSGCLSGTTREFLLENFSIEEKQTSLVNLFEAEQIFLTSAGIGVVQVAEFNNRKLNSEKHKLTQILNSTTTKI